MKKYDKEQPENRDEVENPTNPAPPSNKESQHKTTKSLIGYVSDGFRYIGEALRDDKDDESANNDQEEPQTSVKSRGRNNASGKAAAAKLRRKKKEEAKSVRR